MDIFIKAIACSDYQTKQYISALRVTRGLKLQLFRCTIYLYNFLIRIDHTRLDGEKGNLIVLLLLLFLMLIIILIIIVIIIANTYYNYCIIIFDLSW